MPPIVIAAVLASEAVLDARLGSALAGGGALVAMATPPPWRLLAG